MVADRPNSAAASPTSEATTENQTTSELRALEANALIEEPTDELSVLLLEKVDGAVNHDEPLFIPKNPLPDPELYALAKSMESCYEQNDEAWKDNGADNSHFDFSKLSSASSLLPPPTKTFPRKRVALFVAAAVAIAFAGAVGGWYAALKSMRIITAKAPPAVSPSVNDSAPIAPLPSLEKVDTTTPRPIQHKPELKASTVPAEPLAISQTTRQTIVVDKIKSYRPRIDPARDSISDSERVSRASTTERSAAATTTPEVPKGAVESAISPLESSEIAPTIARSDRSEDGIAEPRDSENPAPTQINEATESAEVSETSAAGNPVVSPSIPEVLTREQVRDGFKSIYQQIRQCAAGKYGVAKIKATVAGSGRVVFALVDGAFKGSPEGSCMARAVRKLTFPKFAKSKLTVEFPYVL